MSTSSVDLFQQRLKSELTRLKLKPVDVARLSGVEDSQPIRDVIGGRKRLTVELLASITGAGIDAAYVLTGVAATFVTSPDERLLLDRYRTSPQPLRDAALRVLLGGETPPEKVHGQMVFHAATGPITKVEGGGNVFTVSGKPGKNESVQKT